VVCERDRAGNSGAETGPGRGATAAERKKSEAGCDRDRRVAEESGCQRQLLAGAFGTKAATRANSDALSAICHSTSTVAFLLLFRFRSR